MSRNLTSLLGVKLQHSLRQLIDSLSHRGSQEEGSTSMVGLATSGGIETSLATGSTT